MPHPAATLACCLAWLLCACSPALNWRDTPVDATSLTAMFPCKPDKSTRKVEMGGREVELVMASCDAAGGTFAVGHAHIPEPSLLGPVLLQWRVATLNGLRARDSALASFVLERAIPLPQAVRVEASGMTANGQTVALQAAWFARGTDVFVALLYGAELRSEMSEPFFGGLRFR